MKPSHDPNKPLRTTQKIWRVLKGNGQEIKISGSKAIVVASGALLFLDMDDEVVHTIAGGNWMECTKEA